MCVCTILGMKEKTLTRCIFPLILLNTKFPAECKVRMFFLPQLVFSIYNCDSGQTDRGVAAYRFFYLQHRADVYTHTHTKHKKKKNGELWIKESDQCWQWKLKAPVWLNRKKFGVRHLCAGDLFYSLWDREPWKDAFHLFENLKNSSSRTRCLYSYWIKWWSQRKNPRLLLCRSCIFEALNKGLWLTRCDFTNEF